jgi:hypothetical protein
MPTIESVPPPPAAEWLPRSAASAARQRQLLADREVEAAPPAGPRNPVLRAFAHLGWVLSHKLASALPALRRHFSAGARAADNTRELLRSTLEHLASGDATPAQLAAHVLKLARAKSEWARRDPDLQPDFFDRAVEHMLDTHWPHDRGIALIAAINGEKCAESQRLLHATDPGNEQLLMQLATSIHGVVYQRAFDTIDAEFSAALAVIRDDALPSLIELHAEQAVQHSVAILRQLRDCWVLAPLPLRREDSAAAASSRQEAVRTVEILESRLQALEAKEEAIDRLIGHLSPDSLQALRVGSQTRGRIGPAVENEIDRRRRALTQQLVEEVQTSSRAEEKWLRARSPAVFEENLARITRLVRCAQEHERAFPAPGSSPQLAEALQAADELIVEASRSDLISSLKREAKAHIQAFGDRLLARESGGAWLADVKKATAVLHAYLNAIEPTDAAGPKHRFTQQFELLLEEMVSDLPHPGGAENRAAAVDSAMQQPEVRALLDVLREAARQAADDGLPELHADLEHACQALLSTQRFAAKRARQASPEDTRRNSAHRNPPKRDPPRENPRALSADTRAELEDLYSTVIESDGRVRLTAGRCSLAFAAHMTTAIEMPFSESELAQSRLPGGTLVPRQFYEDAKRLGTIYLGHDGERLIDPRGWEGLTPDARDRRIEAGYLRLVAFYQGNTTQTDLILRNANQTLVAAVEDTQAHAEGSPFVLSDFGVGVLAGTGSNGTHETVVRFKTGENQQPRVELSYEVLGGVIWPQSYNRMHEADEAASPRRYLDRFHSRAKITLAVEADGDKLKVIGIPTYDVRLKRNWAKRPYPSPKRQDLLASMNTTELYHDLKEFAARHYPHTENTLMILQSLSSINAFTASLDLSNRLWNLYRVHLRAQAPQPLLAAPPPSGSAFEKLITLMDELERQAQQQVLDQSNVLPAGPEQARPWVESLCRELVTQLPEKLFSDFITHITAEYPNT